MNREGIARTIASDELFMAIQEAEHILLTVHVNPDGDAIGSMLAFYELLVKVHKKVSMVVDDNVPKKFLVLPYAQEVQQPDTFLEGGSVDLVLVLDASTWERIGRVGSLTTARILNIDHHISNSRFADALYLDAEAAATGEIVTMLIKRWNMPMTESMATSLYLAIAADTGFFKFSNTTPKTLAAASLLVKEGAKTQTVATIMDTVTIARMEAMKRATNTISYSHAGSAAMMILDEETMKLVDYDSDGFVDMIRNIEGVELAILLKTTRNGETKVSFRSQQLDVNALASTFGGGGHILAAGCSIESSLEEAIHLLWERVATHFGRTPLESLLA